MSEELKLPILQSCAACGWYERGTGLCLQPEIEFAREAHGILGAVGAGSAPPPVWCPLRKKESEERFYIRHRQPNEYPDDDALWWRPEWRGYTTSLAEAGQYPKEEAEEIVRRRPTKDEMIATSLADSHARRSVLVKRLAPQEKP